MLALMKPSSVATRSSTRGTSCGVTVVTRTSGGGGPVCAGLREQATSAAQIRTAQTSTTRFMNLLSLLELKCRASIGSLHLSLSGDCSNAPLILIEESFCSLFSSVLLVSVVNKEHAEEA